MSDSGTKFDVGKVPLDLLPPQPLLDIAQVLAFGASKYSSYNWAKGMNYSRVYAALLRHLFSWWAGQSTDPETGLSHLAHAGCCLLFLIQFTHNRTSFDDRPIDSYADPKINP